MKPNFIFIHSTGGDPSECWYPWLEKELKKKDYKVTIPFFTSPENQSLKTWLKAFENYWDKIDANTILIGRSIGAPFILHLLEKIDVKIKAAFLVAGFSSDIGRPEFNDVVNSFIEKPFDWERINNNCEKFFVYHGDDDPIVDLKYGEELAKNLYTKLIVIEEGGHFNLDTRFANKFEKILEDIEKMI